MRGLHGGSLPGSTWTFRMLEHSTAGILCNVLGLQTFCVNDLPARLPSARRFCNQPALAAITSLLLQGHPQDTPLPEHCSEVEQEVGIYTRSLAAAHATLMWLHPLQGHAVLDLHRQGQEPGFQYLRRRFYLSCRCQYIRYNAAMCDI